MNGKRHTYTYVQNGGNIILALQLNLSTCIQGNEIIRQCSKCNDQRTRYSVAN